MISKTNRGMTLVEVIVGVALMFIIGGALVSLVVGAIASSNTSVIRSTATRLAEQKMEQVKAAEQANKVAIQGGNFSSITGMQGQDYVALGTAAKFFNRNVIVTTLSPTEVQVVVTVAWTDRGVAPKCSIGKNCITLETYITQWQ